MHEGGNSEEQISEKLSVYQVIYINTCVLLGDNCDLPTSSRPEDRADFAMFRSAHLETIGHALSMLYFVHCTQNLIGSIKYKRMGCFL